MPDFHNPRFVHVDPGGGGGLVAAAVVVVAGIAGLLWLARELLHIWKELAVIAGGTVAFVVVLGTYLAVKFNRGSLPVNQEAKAIAIANTRAAAVTTGETRTDNRQVHHHYDERQLHYHDNRTVHVHQAPAADPQPAIAAPKVVPGVVLGAAPEAIEASKAPRSATRSRGYKGSVQV
jgi:hypothetical protein